ncbi:MAG: peptidylprolyl isomerase [Blastocatellia bacterium]|nr:peptidylprolyl isomerase [Blastocatellia bacterium]
MQIKRRVPKLLLITVMFIAQACSLLGGSDFKSLSPTDLSTLADSLPDAARRALSQNENHRKQLIETFRKSFSLAQAAEAEGLQKTDKFKRQFNLTIDSLLANEQRKRNPDATISKDELDAYYKAHKEDCEADFKSIFEGQSPMPGEDQKEIFKTQWNQLKVRSEKARQSGLEKDKIFAVQVKFSKANMLAEQYKESLDKRFQLTPEEKSKYIAEHPEADPEKVRQKAMAVLERVKKGESFEKIADEINEDGTKGKGGDLDWFPKGRMLPEFENAAFALKKGQTSDLVKTKFGYHIIRVDDKREVKPQPLPFAPPAAGGDTDAGKDKTVEEIHARHILISTREVDGFEQRLIDEKVKKVMDEMAVKYPVKAPPDFLVTLPGKEPNKAK